MPEIYRHNTTAKKDVGVIVGSRSDIPFIKGATGVLESFGVNWEFGIKSAHRTPERMVEYARSARERGLKLIIAGAGGSAHLPGMVASETTLPVVGVPIEQGAITGLNEAVGSMIRMPDGAPLVIVGPNKAKLAGEFAIRVLALSDSHLAEQYEASVAEMQQAVIVDDERIGQVGLANFAAEQGIK